MNDDQIDDLKQFIATTVSQQTTDIRDDLQKVETKIDDLSSAVKKLHE